ncbi:MAG: radical SAM protein [Silvibacterium sp.]|nr:radical SAM protein [Silvibacterium sp.]MBV8436038.1 radical SAM protein [Silvibacterium sp.]
MSEEKANIKLFHILPPDGIPPKGIARLAESGCEAGEGHLVEFRTLPVRSLMNRVVSRRRLPFTWSINPYRGCEFGCRYCYARYTHEFMELRDPADFERKIYIKQSAAWLLRQELRSLKSNEPIAIGTATDPYQPIERRANITRSILEVFAGERGLSLGIVTKSTLIERDIDLLQQIAANNDLTVHITITTHDARLARILEPRAPRPDLRFRTVRCLREARLRTGVMCSPLMPGITDSGLALDTMARKSREADASFLFANPLFLKPCSKATFLAFVHEHFPQLDSVYAKRYEEAFVSRAYQRRVADLVAAVKRKYRLGNRVGEGRISTDKGREEGRTPRQQSFWPEETAPRKLALAQPARQRVMMTS